MALWVRLYAGELNARNSGERVNALLDRRPPTLLRIAMLLALTDETVTVEAHHITAALAWIRYWTDSVRFIFASDDDEAASAELSDLAEKIGNFLELRGQASRKGLTVECFGRHQSKGKIDAALDELLHATPPRITVQAVPRADAAGTPTKVYRLLAANCAKSANCEQQQALTADSWTANSANCQQLNGHLSSHGSHGSQSAHRPQTRASAHSSHSSHSSQAGVELSADTADVEVL